MEEAKKEKQRIVEKYNMQPSKLLYVKPLSDEERNDFFEKLRKDLMHFKRCWQMRL